ncbi:MAG: helix-turn-helix domain-containing protein [Candidatus Peribacteraceae bacterium]|nr:helix-turn-helix domain-containing protein [Candidatus Peribacteraceae bacterium]
MNRKIHISIIPESLPSEGGEQQPFKKLGLSADALRRLEWFVFAEQQGKNLREVAGHFGVAPSTVYRWANKFDPNDLTTLENRTTTPPQEKRRKPQTPDAIVQLIAQYRRVYPLMGKKGIAEALLHEHGVELSPATIGREIQRNKLYFADTPSHRLKRLRAEVDAHQSGRTLSVIRMDTGSQIRLLFHSERKPTEPGGMPFSIIACLIACAAGLAFLGGAQRVHAAEGVAFRVQTTFPNQEAEGQLTGNAFQLSNDELTNTRKPLIGSDFRITIKTASNVSPSSSSSASVASTTSLSATEGMSTGGHRGAGTFTNSRSSIPRPNTETVPHPAAPANGESAVPSGTVHPAQALPANVSHPVAGTQVYAGRPPSMLPGIAPPQRIYPSPTQPGSVMPPERGTQNTQWIALVALILLFAFGVTIRNIESVLPIVRTITNGNTARIVRVIVAVIFAVIALIALLSTRNAQAATTPDTSVYQGILQDSAGDPVTSSVTFRFSYWNSADFTSGDLTGTGAINIAAGTYIGWYEEHTLTPNSDGSFSVVLGSETSLPDLSTLSQDVLTGLYLQVEVKNVGDADTSYDLLDVDSNDDSVDRSQIHSVPFAQNAETVDQHSVGTGSGAIPLLGSGGALTLDNGSSQSGSVTLQFGALLAKTLKYNIPNTRFEFSADTFINGTLTLSGSTIGTGTGAGTIRWNGSDLQGYNGSGWTALDLGGGVFVGVTPATTSGSFVGGGFRGYQAGNYLCGTQYEGSHMCQVNEIVQSTQKDISSFSGTDNAWVANGPPGYTADANDCKGWTSSGNTVLGPWWEFSSDGGGQGHLTNCAVEQAIACCR